jgi:hypothetical protein
MHPAHVLIQAAAPDSRGLGAHLRSHGHASPTAWGAAGDACCPPAAMPSCCPGPAAARAGLLQAVALQAQGMAEERVLITVLSWGTRSVQLIIYAHRRAE